MKAHLEIWNRKYREQGNKNPDFIPDSLLVEHRALLPPTGRALDFACGVGHNALYLAQLGYQVTAIDGSDLALEFCRQAAQQRNLQLTLIQADVEEYSLPAAHYDLVIVFRFLLRHLIKKLQAAVVPGGLLIYQAFNRNRLASRPDFNPDFLLEFGELAGYFSAWEIIATNDTADNPSAESFVIARCPGRQ